MLRPHSMHHLFMVGRRTCGCGVRHSMRHPTTLRRNQCLLQLEKMQQEVKDAHAATHDHELDIDELRRRLDECAVQAKVAQKQREALRVELVGVSRALTEARDSICEAQRKEIVHKGQLDTLKEDVHVKDRALIAESFERRTIEKRHESRTRESLSLQRLVDEAANAAVASDARIVGLGSALERLDVDAQTQRHAYDRLLSERDLVAAQLVHRNGELAAAREKLGIVEVTLAANTCEQAHHTEESRALRRALRDAQRRAAAETACIAVCGGIDEVKAEACSLRRTLQSERGKLAALAALDNIPSNRHPWRRLEAVDPDAFVALGRAHEQQRRLISATAEVAASRTRIAELERTVGALRSVAQSTASRSSVEALDAAKAELAGGHRERQALSAELVAARAAAAEARCLSDAAAMEVTDAKRAHSTGRKLIHLGDILE